MKIVILSDRIPPENAGGAERVAWLLAGGLCAAGHTVHLITGTGARGENGKSVEREGIHVHYLYTHVRPRWVAWQGLYNPQTVAPIRALLRQIEPDVVNAHNVHGGPSWASIGVAYEQKIPVVYTAHDMMSVAYGKLTHFIDPARPTPPDPAGYRLPPGYNLRQMRLRYNPVRNLIIRRFLDRTSARVCVSETQRQALAANGLTGFQVVHNGIDPTTYDQPAVIERATNYHRDVLQDRPTVLFAGRLSREKGADVLLRAWRLVNGAVPEARLLLLCRPEQATRMQLEFPDLAQSIIAGGWLDGAALAAAFRAVNCVVVPSLFLESLPMVALEAMAARKPAVVSPFGGLVETVEDGKSGFIVNPFESGALAERIITLLHDPALARRMGDAGRARIESGFTLTRQVQAMEHVFESVIRP